MSTCVFVYRLVGPTHEARRLVIADTVFRAYAECDPRAKVDCEAYLSAFCYGDDFRARADNCGIVDTKNFNGVCWSPWVWWDIDREGDLETSLIDTRRLATTLSERVRFSDENALIFFSGNKGFHLGLSTVLWQPEPSAIFHRVARRFAEMLAEVAGVTIDTGVYDKVRAFRAPNSRHPKTGLYKRRLTFDELANSTLGEILQAAQQPEPFDVPTPTETSSQAAEDWCAAAQHVERQAEASRPTTRCGRR